MKTVVLSFFAACGGLLIGMLLIIGPALAFDVVTWDELVRTVQNITANEGPHREESWQQWLASLPDPRHVLAAAIVGAATILGYRLGRKARVKH